MFKFITVDLWKNCEGHSSSVHRSLGWKGGALLWAVEACGSSPLVQLTIVILGSVKECVTDGTCITLNSQCKGSVYLKCHFYTLLTDVIPEAIIGDIVNFKKTTKKPKPLCVINWSLNCFKRWFQPKNVTNSILFSPGSPLESNTVLNVLLVIKQTSAYIFLSIYRKFNSYNSRSALFIHSFILMTHLGRTVNKSTLKLLVYKLNTYT